MNTTVKKILRFVPMVVLMAVIFAFSATPAEQSSEQSGFIVKIITDLFGDAFTGNVPPKILGSLDFFVRKCAHFLEYTAFGLTVLLALSDMLKKPWARIRVPEVISFLYACSDEFHQRFVPGRSAKFADVLIDSCGALFGLLIAALIQRHRFNNDKKKELRDF